MTKIIFDQEVKNTKTALKNYLAKRISKSAQKTDESPQNGSTQAECDKSVSTDDDHAMSAKNKHHFEDSKSVHKVTKVSFF